MHVGMMVTRELKPGVVTPGFICYGTADIWSTWDLISVNLLPYLKDVIPEAILIGNPSSE
jgi:hypothetical protein